MRRGWEEIKTRGAEVVVVGPDGREAFARVWERDGLPFVGLPDPELEVLRLYGQQVRLLRLGRMPAQVVVDRRGLVRWAHYGASMADIPPVEELLAVLDGLGED